MSENEISVFRGPHDFLSNFYAADVELEGAEYPTIEHAFQAAKSLDYAERRAVKNAKSASEAKRMGRKIKRALIGLTVSLEIMDNIGTSKVCALSRVKK